MHREQAVHLPLELDDTGLEALDKPLEPSDESIGVVLLLQRLGVEGDNIHVEAVVAPDRLGCGAGWFREGRVLGGPLPDRVELHGLGEGEPLALHHAHLGFEASGLLEVGFEVLRDIPAGLATDSVLAAALAALAGLLEIGLELWCI
eukprot:5641085-Alexandrium_andersonii.AAC.1